MNTTSQRIRLFIAALILILILTFLGSELRESGSFNVQTIRIFLSQLGPLAIPGFILIMFIAVISPLPDSMVSVSGGYLFGPFIGAILSLIGSAIGTTFDFFLVRKLGRNYVKKKFPDSIAVIDQYALKLGWQTVIIMRIVPSVTFDLIGYAAGLSSMPFSVYLASTMIGMFPATLFTVFLGRSIKVGSWTDAFIILSVGIICLIIGTVVMNRVNTNLMKRSNK